MDCTIHVAKTKALISFAVTAKLICVFVFAYAKSRFSHDTANMLKSFKGMDTWLFLKQYNLEWIMLNCNLNASFNFNLCAISTILEYHLIS